MQERLSEAIATASTTPIPRLLSPQQRRQIANVVEAETHQPQTGQTGELKSPGRVVKSAFAVMVLIEREGTAVTPAELGRAIYGDNTPAKAAMNARALVGYIMGGKAKAASDVLSRQGYEIRLVEVPIIDAATQEPTGFQQIAFQAMKVQTNGA